MSATYCPLMLELTGLIGYKYSTVCVINPILEINCMLHARYFGDVCLKTASVCPTGVSRLFYVLLSFFKIDSILFNS